MRKLFILIFTLISLIALIYGIINSQWYLLAIPVGLLFGFFLQKGDLCASSAMSEAVMYKDRSKLWGFWVAIVTTMLSFAIIDYFGLINVNPKPLLWMSSIVGGVIFGTGMVLAGGCISGVVYKSGTGNINSIMALMAVPFGVAAVEFGPMNEVHLFMKNFLIRGENGNSVTLYSITGLPYLSLAAAFALLTALYV